MQHIQVMYLKSLFEKIAIGFGTGFISSLVASGIDISHFDKISVLAKAVNGGIGAALGLIYGLLARLNGPTTASLVDKG